MLGWKYEKFKAELPQDKFEELLQLFQELLLYSSGNVEDAIKWMMELDREYNITNDDYAIQDFLEDLIKKGFITSDDKQLGLIPTAKMDIQFRKQALNEVFGKIKKSFSGQHHTFKTGKGDEFTAEIRPFQFGDNLEDLEYTESIRNAQINRGFDDFSLEYDDLLVKDTLYQSNMSSVLMIDVSHSMILYGEDRITPAKKVAMALAEYITRRYPNDTLDIVAFGDEAWTIGIDELPYLQVGPYHTNTLAALELASSILRKRKNPNKQIFMITDGKPTCIKRGNKLYKNPMGLDRMIVNRCFNQAAKLKKLGVPITTFMIARDAYLQKFVEKFSETNGGKACYSDQNARGNFVIKDYRHSKNKKGR